MYAALVQCMQHESMSSKVNALQPRFRLVEAVLPLATAALLLLVTVLSGSRTFTWPLGAGALMAAALALRAGIPLKAVVRAALSGIRATMIALSILVLIGGLIGVWKAAGTVPAMVYYGLEFAHPRFLVPAAYLLALAVSMMLGTSIGTLSTLGIAIMGVAQGVGAPVPLVAGALVSGALFGDRSSPLAGSLNLNVAMTGTEVRQVMARLMPTGMAAVAVTLGLYLLLGMGEWGAPETGGDAMRLTIAQHVSLTPWLLLPPVLVLALAFLRVPVKTALAIGMTSGALIGLLIGQADLTEAARAALFGHAAEMGDVALNQMFSGGGILPMAHQSVLLVVAGAFSGIMEDSGMMAVVISGLVQRVRRPLALVGATMAISIAVAAVAANQALSIIVPGRMLRPAYERAGLSPELLSRALADSGTVLAGVIPWNLMGILSAASIGVPVAAFAPYAFLGWLFPLVSLAVTAVEQRRGKVRVAFRVRAGA